MNSQPVTRETCLVVERVSEAAVQPLHDHLVAHGFDVAAIGSLSSGQVAANLVDTPIFLLLDSAGSVDPSGLRAGLLVLLPGTEPDPELAACATRQIRVSALDTHGFREIVLALQELLHELPPTPRRRALAAFRSLLAAYQNDGNMSADEAIEGILGQTLECENRFAGKGNPGDAASLYLTSATPLLHLLRISGANDHREVSTRIEAALAHAQTKDPNASRELHALYVALLKSIHQRSLNASLTSLESASPSAVRKVVENAINIGAPQYDAGCRSKCARLYRDTARSILQAIEAKSAEAGDDLRGVQHRLESALHGFKLAGHDSIEAENFAIEHQARKFAWALRDAFDQILATPFEVEIDQSRPASKAMGKGFTSFEHADRNKICDVFISYARSDYTWLDKLNQHLDPLERDHGVRIWHDARIGKGEVWGEELERNLWGAKVGVILLSSAALASDFICRHELPVLLKRAADKSMRLLIIVLAPCQINGVRIKVSDPQGGMEIFRLGQFQFVNEPRVPLLSLSEADQERIFVEVGDEICNALGLDTGL